MLGLQGKVAFVLALPVRIQSHGQLQVLSDSESSYTLVIRRGLCQEFSVEGKVTSIEGFYPLDVCIDATTKEFFDAFSKENPMKADILIHAIGFAPRACFDRPILFVEDSDINTAMTISANSFRDA